MMTTTRPQLTALAALLLLASTAAAQMRIDAVCRPKGLEENRLHGVGLVVGLNGTGDGNLPPTARALARMMGHLGVPAVTGVDRDPLAELKNAKNVALVTVTATVPALGGRQGDRIDCTVQAIGAKSLEGGVLMMTALLGPRPGDQRVYAVAAGELELEDGKTPTVGKIARGCQLEFEFRHAFTNGNEFTLVIDRDHASPQMAQIIAETINSIPGLTPPGSTRNRIAKAVDPKNVVVQITDTYKDDPVAFISDILNERILIPQSSGVVVINQRTGAIVIGADVEIGPIAVSHKNLVIQAGAAKAGEFVPLDASPTPNTKLKALVDALNEINASSEDVIEIIKTIKRSGKLYGRLILE